MASSSFGCSSSLFDPFCITPGSSNLNIFLDVLSVKLSGNLGGFFKSFKLSILKSSTDLVCDIRSEEQVEECVEKGAEHFGGIDICGNNASAIQLTNTLQTDMKRYDLMNQINARGTFLTSKKCLPHLLKSENPHIMNLSPPLDMNPKWFSGHVAYTMAKYGMSLCVLGMAEEFKDQGVAVNALWPRTAISTAAVKNVLGGEEMANISRTPEIMADAAYVILTKPSKEFTGNFCIDDNLLAEHGVKDFSKYASVPFDQLAPDFFVPDDILPPEAAKNS